MAGRSEPTDTITNIPLLPRFLSRPNARHPQALPKNPTPLRLLPRSHATFNMSRWPRWAFILFTVAVGLTGLLLVILTACLCARRRRRKAMTTVAKQEAAACGDKAGGSFISLASTVQQQQLVVAPRRLHEPLPRTPAEEMVDVPLVSGRGRGPASPFGGGYGAPGPHSSLGTTAMAGLRAEPVVESSAFSVWGSPKERQGKKFGLDAVVRKWKS